MERLKEVAEATALMQEAVNWSVMRWLTEKKRVRRAADRANNAIDTLNQNLKNAWSDDLKAAYAEIFASAADSSGQQIRHKGDHAAGSISPEIEFFVKQMMQADDDAYRARMAAEDIFDRAEKRLSASMAREGTRKTIASWELYEKAIELAQTGIHPAKTTL